MKSPKTARWLLKLTLEPEERDDVVANLEELYRAMHYESGAGSAYLWYWLQALTFSVQVHAAGPHISNTQAPVRFRLKDSLMQLLEDARFALRSFLKSPGFTLGAIATLALGLGVNTVIYAVVNAAVFQPLPFPDADRLVWAFTNGNVSLTMQQFTELQTGATNLAELTAFTGRNYAIVGGEAPDEVSGTGVTTNHFDVFKTSPLVGRSFNERDGVPGAELVALISYGLWQSHFGGEASVVGQRVNLYTSAAIPMVPGAFSGAPYTIIGVLPTSYQPFGYQAEVFTPLIEDPSDPNYANMGEMSVVGRLTPGATTRQLQDELVRLSNVIPSLKNSREQIALEEVSGLRDALVGNLRAAMFVTLGAVGLVLLIACANVANLALARTEARRGELAVRHALGASRTRLASQLLTESTILSAAAAVVGLAAARVSLPAVVSLLPPGLTGTSVVVLDGSVLLFSLAALMLTGMLSGSVPALHSTKHPAFKAARGQRGAGSNRHFVNRGIVVGEIALALVLAYGAGLLVKSFTRLTVVDAGFSADNVMTIRVAPSEQKFIDPNVRRDLYSQILERLRNVPGMLAAGAIHFLPIADGGPAINYLIDPTDPETRQSSGYRVITPGYLEAMSIPVLRGRTITDNDGSGSELVGLVNDSLARGLWPEGDALGQSLYRTNGRRFFTVIGIAGDVRQSALGLPPLPEIYLPLSQSGWASAMTIVARTAGPVPGTTEQLREIVRSVDPNLPITRISTMDSIVNQSLESPRFYGILFSVFAILALALGGIGVYGLISSAVSQRTDEIGIRLALGATRGDIIRQEIGTGLRMTALGMGIGLLAAAGVSTLLSGLLFEASPFDLPVFAGTATMLGAIAFLGVAIPAFRASRMDPLVAIRAGD